MPCFHSTINKFLSDRKLFFVKVAIYQVKHGGRLLSFGIDFSCTKSVSPFGFQVACDFFSSSLTKFSKKKFKYFRRKIAMILFNNLFSSTYDEVVACGSISFQSITV